MLLLYKRMMGAAVGLCLVLSCNAGADSITESSLAGGVPIASTSTAIDIAPAASTIPVTAYADSTSGSVDLTTPAPIAAFSTAAVPASVSPVSVVAALPAISSPVNNADATGVPDMNTHHVPQAFAPVSTPLPTSALGGIALLGGMGLWMGRRRGSRAAV